MKECEEFAPLLSAFVDGELTEEERAEVLAHVSECEKCRRLLGELTALHAALGELEDEDVPAGFTEGVMAAVRAEKAAKKPQTKKRSAWRRWMPMAACAAIDALAAAVTIPRTAMKQEANDAAPAAPAAQEDQAMFSMAAPSSDPLPDTDAEVEYPEQRCETVQSSPYYDRQLGGAAADGFKTANAPADLENGSPEAEYYCETAPIGESGEEGSLLKGVEMTLRGFEEALNKMGLERVEAEPGTVFDPEKHNAVMMTEADEEHPEGTIVECFQTGFAVKGKVVRYAMVRVAN